jgi:hypothetical protein
MLDIEQACSGGQTPLFGQREKETDVIPLGCLVC